MHRIMQVAIPLIVCMVVLFALKFFLFGSVSVTIPKKTGGMRPAIGKETERFTIAASPRDRRRIKRGDIVAYRLRKSIFAARVVALAGDRIAIKDGKVKVNGRALKVPGLRFLGRLQLPEIRVPRDCLYLLTDRAVREMDSTRSGPIDRRMVLGKILINE